MKKLVLFIFLLLLLAACQRQSPELVVPESPEQTIPSEAPPEPVTEVLPEHLYGGWALWFGSAGEKEFYPTDSGVASAYFARDGTGNYRLAWEDAIIPFTWSVSDGKITLVHEQNSWSGELRFFENITHAGISISWDEGGPDWEDADSDWGLFRYNVGT